MTISKPGQPHIEILGLCYKVFLNIGDIPGLPPIQHDKTPAYVLQVLEGITAALQFLLHLDTTKSQSSTPVPAVKREAAHASPETPTETEPVFDHAAMSRRLMGDETLIKTVAKTFLSDLPNSFEGLSNNNLTI